MNLRKSQKLFYSCLAFLIGVAIGEVIQIPINIFYWLIGLLIANIFIMKKTRIWAFFCLMIVVGILCNNLSNPIIDKNHISYYNDETISFRALISSEVESRLDKQRLIVEPVDYKGKVLITTYLYPEYQYGELLEVKCRLQKPEQIENFKYDKFLAKDGIYSLCYQPRIDVLERDKGNIIYKEVLSIKYFIAERINRTVSEPAASLLNGILLGTRSGFSQELIDQFNKMGVTHIIAISGFNITIIVVVLLNIFKNLCINRKKAFWIIIACLIFFVIITGMSASVMRAAVMGVVVLLAKQLGRSAKIDNVLIFSASILVLFNPKILIWDAGFQLSFISTIGLIYFSPVIKDYLTWLPEKFSIRENLISTMSAIIMTLPLILFQFGRLSIVAPIVNLLVLPAIPASMLVGFIQIIVASIWILPGQIIGWFSWLILTYVVKIVEIFSSLPFAAVNIKIDWWVMVVLYFYIFYLIANKKSAQD